jgi:hypothetical protein
MHRLINYDDELCRPSIRARETTLHKMAIARGELIFNK